MEFLSVREVAKRYNVGVSTVWAWVREVAFLPRLISREDAPDGEWSICLNGKPERRPRRHRGKCRGWAEEAARDH